MATNSIGTGGDFSTPQLWEDDIPATLTEPRIGQLMNQEFVSTGILVNFSAHVTSVSNFILLECQAGASFQDNANVRTNALRYNASNGAGLRNTSTNEVIRLDGSCNHITFQGLQLQNTGAVYQNRAFVQGTNGASTNLVVRDCIMEVTASTTPVVRQAAGSSGVQFINCLIIQRGGGASIGVDSQSAGTTDFIGCTIVAPSNNTSTGTGLSRGYGTVTAIDCVVAGFSVDVAALSGSSNFNGTNLSDAASALPGANNTYDVPYTTATFVQPSDAGGTHDFRLVAGSDLEDAGVANGAMTTDISGQARANPPDIGVWELAATGGGAGGFAAVYYEELT